MNKYLKKILLVLFFGPFGFVYGQTVADSLSTKSTFLPTDSISTAENTSERIVLRNESDSTEVIVKPEHSLAKVDSVATVSQTVIPSETLVETPSIQNVYSNTVVRETIVSKVFSTTVSPDNTLSNTLPTTKMKDGKMVLQDMGQDSVVVVQDSVENMTERNLKRKQAILNSPLYYLDPIFSVKKLNVRNIRIEPKETIIPIYAAKIPFFYAKRAKVTYWKYGMNSSLKFSQASFSDNWNGGGMSSVAISSWFNGTAEYKKELIEYFCEVDFRYGKTWNKNQMVRKNLDRIFIDNKLAYKMDKQWLFFSALRLESQFDNGYLYSLDANGKEVRALISNFMVPGYLTESVGFEYFINKVFSARLGILTMRQTFVLDKTIPKEYRYGLADTEIYRNDPAFEIVVNFNKDIIKDLQVKGRYAGLLRYKTISNPNNRFDIGLETKLSRWFTVSFSGVVVQDYFISKDIQTSSFLEMGLSYSFPD